MPDQLPLHVPASAAPGALDLPCPAPLTSRRVHAPPDPLSCRRATLQGLWCQNCGIGGPHYPQHLWHPCTADRLGGGQQTGALPALNSLN